VRVSRFVLVLILCLTAFDSAHAGALERLFAPKSVPWSYWDSSDQSNSLKVDHSLWDAFVNTYVQNSPDGINRVRYAGVAAEDRNALLAYIEQLSQLPIRQYARNEQLAYWINLYNAVTVSVVLEHYPVESIRQINISPGFFAMGPWSRKLLVIEDQAVSLNDIEHRILRPLWQDPRLHYALNCASLGCPNLQNQAFTAANVEQLLEAGAREFINHPRGVTVKKGRLYVSSIYNWFRVDFGDSQQAVIQHLRKYASPQLADALAPLTRIKGDDYDWQLNDANPVRKPPTDKQQDY
jgi:hypothetical protein